MFCRVVQPLPLKASLGFTKINLRRANFDAASNRRGFGLRQWAPKARDENIERKGVGVHRGSGQHGCRRRKVQRTQKERCTHQQHQLQQIILSMRADAEPAKGRGLVPVPTNHRRVWVGLAGIDVGQSG